MQTKIEMLHERRDRVDQAFLRMTDLLRPVDSPKDIMQDLANLALIGGRLDTMLRREYAAKREASRISRAQESRA